MTILHQLSRSLASSRIPEFEALVKYPTKWMGFRPSYLDHLLASKDEETEYGDGAGLDILDHVNIMKCNDKCVKRLEAWLGIYDDLQNNDWLLSIALASEDDQLSGRIMPTSAKLRYRG